MRDRLTTSRAELARAAERALGMAALAVVGPESRENLQAVTLVVSTTELSLRKLLGDARRWNDREMRLWALYWTASKAVADRMRETLEAALEADGERSPASAHWVRADPLAIDLVLAEVALAETGRVFDRAERDRRIEAEVGRMLGRGMG